MNGGEWFNNSHVEGAIGNTCFVSAALVINSVSCLLWCTNNSAPEYKPLIKVGKCLEEEKVSYSSLSYTDHNKHLRLEASRGLG